MSRGIIGFLSVNQGVTSLSGESRQYRLPKANPFPKLDKRVRSVTVAKVEPAALHRPVAELPEVSTDLIDVSSEYSVENVKRDRKDGSVWSRAGLGLLLGRVWGGDRAARL